MNDQYNDFYYLEHQPPNMNPLFLSEQEGYIKLLKRRLKNLKYFQGEVDGNFDINLHNAILKLQHDKGLTLTGILNDKLLEVIFSPTESQVSLLKEEHTTDDMLILEIKLKKTNLYPEIVVDKMEPSIIKPKVITSPLETTKENIYVVQSGDTLWSIAKRFDTTVDKIMRVNNLTSDLLSIGQRLVIPRMEKISSLPNVYTVVKGDTLWDIAKRFNTTIADIMVINNLTNSDLSIGQQLFIPSSKEGPHLYTIQHGDTLWSTAKIFDTTVDEIMRANGLTSSNLSIGQQLIIPS